MQILLLDFSTLPSSVSSPICLTSPGLFFLGAPINVCPQGGLLTREGPCDLVCADAEREVWGVFLYKRTLFWLLGLCLWPDFWPSYCSISVPPLLVTGSYRQLHSAVPTPLPFPSFLFDLIQGLISFQRTTAVNSWPWSLIPSPSVVFPAHDSQVILPQTELPTPYTKQ